LEVHGQETRKRGDKATVTAWLGIKQYKSQHNLRSSQQFLRSEVRKGSLAAGFKKIEISIVAAEEQPPHFQTILAGGGKS
jgi:hypothetical protein